MTDGALMNAKQAAEAMGLPLRTFFSHLPEFKRHILATNGIGRFQYSRAKVMAYADQPVKKLIRRPRLKKSEAA